MTPAWKEALVPWVVVPAFVAYVVGEWWVLDHISRNTLGWLTVSFIVGATALWSVSRYKEAKRKGGGE